MRKVFLADYYYEYYAKMLAPEAKRRGLRIERLPDTVPGKEDCILWTDVRSYLYPRRALQLLRCWLRGVPMRLVLLEPPVVHPYNYLRIFHLPFRRVYTWNDRLVGGKYRKFLWPQSSEGRTLTPVPFGNRELLAIFCANKKPALPWHPGSLYGERIRAMRFFARHEGFAIYGRGWEGFPAWKGWVDDKLGNLKRYKFSICYENQRGKRGYITEKIWDSLKARCVPIYWGAENIEKYVPSDCYIDRRKFKDDAEVLAFIAKMPKKTHDAYVRRIDAHVRSAFDAWTYDAWAKTILEEL